MAETEDVPYEVSDFATPDKEEEQDPDQPNKSVLLDVAKYCEEQIAEHNTFDVINLPANAKPEEKIAAFDDMAIHKGVAMHLRNIKSVIDDKLKELK